MCIHIYIYTNTHKYTYKICTHTHMHLPLCEWLRLQMRASPMLSGSQGSCARESSLCSLLGHVYVSAWLCRGVFARLFELDMYMTVYTCIKHTYMHIYDKWYMYIYTYMYIYIYSSISELVKVCEWRRALLILTEGGTASEWWRGVSTADCGGGHQWQVPHTMNNSHTWYLASLLKWWLF